MKVSEKPVIASFGQTYVPTQPHQLNDTGKVLLWVLFSFIDTKDPKRRTISAGTPQQDKFWASERRERRERRVATTILLRDWWRLMCVPSAIPIKVKVKGAKARLILLRSSE